MSVTSEDIRSRYTAEQLSNLQTLLNGMAAIGLLDTRISAEDEEARLAEIARAVNELEERLRDDQHGLMYLAYAFVVAFADQDTQSVFYSLFGLDETGTRPLPGQEGEEPAIRLSDEGMFELRRLQSLTDRAATAPGVARAAELAESFIGAREEGGNNRGAIVRLVGGVGAERRREPWCGYFAAYVYNQTMPGVFGQSNVASARGFEWFADNNSRRNPGMEQILERQGMGEDIRIFNDVGPGNAYIPQEGDTIVFYRSGRSSGLGHVAIVDEVVVNEDGTITVYYIGGNQGISGELTEGRSGDGVTRESVTYDPTAQQRGDRGIVGFVDTEALAIGRFLNGDLSLQELNAMGIEVTEEKLRAMGINEETIAELELEGQTVDVAQFASRRVTEGPVMPDEGAETPVEAAGANMRQAGVLDANGDGQVNADDFGRMASAALSNFLQRFGGGPEVG